MSNWREAAEGSDYIKVPNKLDGSDAIALVFEEYEPKEEENQWQKTCYDWPVRMVENESEGRCTLSPVRTLRGTGRRQLRAIAAAFDETEMKELDIAGEKYKPVFLFWREGRGMDTMHYGSLGHVIVSEKRNVKPITELHKQSQL